MNTNRFLSGFLAIVLGLLLAVPASGWEQSDANSTAKGAQKPCAGEKKSDSKHPLSITKKH